MKRVYERPTMAFYEIEETELLTSSNVQFYLFDDEEYNPTEAL